MALLTVLFFLNSIFANSISFTAEQCQRFKAEGITGGDYYINEALARDCGIQAQEDKGQFQPMVWNDNNAYKKDCGIKNMALNESNTGYFQDVVTFNNMHPDYFYPDREDEYPYSFAIQVPGISKKISISNGVSVDIDSIDGCREKIELVLGEKLSSPNVILTAGHTFILNEQGACRASNKNHIKKSAVATGSDVSKYNFSSRISKVICASKSCDQISEDGYNDFCVAITKKNLPNSVKYENIKSINNLNISRLVGYQPSLISSMKSSNIKRTERIVAVNTEPLFTGNTEIMRSSEEFIIHHADSAKGSSGSALLSSNNKLIGINITEGKTSDILVQRGFKGTGAVNYAIDPKIACQRLNTVLN